MTEVIPAASDMVRDMTIYSLLPLWMDNLAQNLPAIRSGLDAHDLPKDSGPAIIVGAGPSLNAYKHLQLIKRSGWKGKIFMCDKMLGEALHMGLIPDYVASIDGNPIIKNFFIRKEVTKHAKDITGVFNVLSHPSVIEAWTKAGGKPWWYISMLDDPDEKGKIPTRSLTNIIYWLTNQKGLISGIGNVGAFMWNLAAGLGYSPIILVGFDFSEQVLDKSDAIYFDFYSRWFLSKLDDKYLTGDAMDSAAALHQIEVNPDVVAPFTKLPYFKKGEHPHYLVNPVWKFYRDSLAMHIVSSKIHTINATGNGCLHSEAKRIDPATNQEIAILKVPNFESANLEEVLKKYA